MGVVLGIETFLGETLIVGWTEIEGNVYLTLGLQNLNFESTKSIRNNFYLVLEVFKLGLPNDLLFSSNFHKKYPKNDFKKIEGQKYFVLLW
jgi:hypothetical protein